MVGPDNSHCSSVYWIEVRIMARKEDTMGCKTVSLAFATLLFFVLVQGDLRAAIVMVYPAPQGEELSQDYAVQVDGQDTPVYVAKVAPADPQSRWKAMDDKKNSADYFEKASFVYFDFTGTVRIRSLARPRSARPRCCHRRTASNRPSTARQSPFNWTSRAI